MPNRTDDAAWKELFHPAVQRWLARRFDAPTPCQREAWPAIRSGASTLIAAPTGSGKTLAAFLAAIDDLLRAGIAGGALEDRTEVVYVSPLKALSNDIEKNLQEPLAGIRDELLALGIADVEVRTAVRTGDTTPAQRERIRRRPPHLLVTTPESLYIMLSSDSGRRMLAGVRSVIVDEIHALAGNKRGAHLALSLERLQALTPEPPHRIGLSATQRPIDTVAAFLTGGRSGCRVIDVGHARERDLAIELTGSPLEAVMATEVWGELYDRVAELVAEHRTTLVFVNTRRLAERAARHLAERIGEDLVTSHHGSLAREHRLDAEQRLKAGQLRALVATASLELGIDIGDVDLVCQIGSPRGIAALLQRVGRSGHALGAVPKGRLFPTSRDDLVECVALLDAARRGELDRLSVPRQPLDVLAQQIVAEVSSTEWEADALYACVRGAYPYRDLERAQFDAVVSMLAAGFSTRRGRRGAHLHFDAVNGRLRGRRGARLVAITNGGAIADQFDYDVVLEPEGQFIGTLNEDFAFESVAGDIFQLGNTSYRVLRVEPGTVRVEDAQGQPPNIPFWFGEAPGRSDELSQAVSRVRQAVSTRLTAGLEAAVHDCAGELGVSEAVSRSLVEYLAAAEAALGVMPTQQTVVFERFFDEAGDSHVVIHSPFGSRINRAWGLALRKRFCRRFNFELQAAALEDSIVLSLGPTHSFPLEEIRHYLHPATLRDVLVQALLAVPLFPGRWRWAANIALAVRRNRNGKRVPAPLQRADAEDLIAVVFPDQLACLENIAGEREVPDHPLVRQTLADCLHEVMDLTGLERLLERVVAGAVTVVARDLTEPSPLACEILAARAYAFLDDAPAEERRTLAVQARRFFDADSAADLGRLDRDAIERVRAEAWPEARSADELHDALLLLGVLTDAEARPDVAGKSVPSPRAALLAELQSQRRATCLQTAAGYRCWVAAERLAQVLALHPGAGATPAIDAVGELAARPWSRDEAALELVRSRLEGVGPTTAAALARSLDLDADSVTRALLALQTEGFVMQGHFSGETDTVEWCERRLLARIHRYTLGRLRREIEPVSARDFMRFLLRWQRLDADTRGEGAEALLAVLEQLEGFEAPLAAWESALLPERIDGYTPSLLDELNLAGRVQWLRLTPPRSLPDGEAGAARRPVPVRSTPLAHVLRANVALWRALAPLPDPQRLALSSSAQALIDALGREGALFFDELVDASAMLRTQVEQTLAELVALGLVVCDHFNGLRALMLPSSRRPSLSGSMRRRTRASLSVEAAGRWSLVRARGRSPDTAATVEAAARVLLRRYGVVFRRLLEREPRWMPPWRELARVYRRLEARGEIRGGRFVAGFSGEQFALAEAVAALRDIRRRAPSGETVSVAAADPANLVGVVVPGERIAPTSRVRVLWRDGDVVAVQPATRRTPGGLAPLHSARAVRRATQTPLPAVPQ